MEFEMNDRIFTIKKVDQDILFNHNKKINDGTANYFGLFLPYEQMILLDDNISYEQAIKTLIHELTHCYIWSYGISCDSYDDEDICNINANSHIIINRIVSDYIRRNCDD